MYLLFSETENAVQQSNANQTQPGPMTQSQVPLQQMERPPSSQSLQQQQQSQQQQPNQQPQLQEQIQFRHPLPPGMRPAMRFQGPNPQQVSEI